MKVGMKIKIGGKHASACSYNSIVDKEGVILSIYTSSDPYLLIGEHTMCDVETDNDYSWEIHIEDCIPVYTNNKERKHLLEKLTD